jgi:heptosyltransferase-2
MRQSRAGSGKKLLVIHTAYPGDLLLLTPLLEVLKSMDPALRLSLLTIPGTAGLFHNNPFLDEVVVYDKRGRDRGIIPFLRLVREVRKKKFDAALIPHPSLRSALIALFGGVRTRAGFAHRWCSFLYTERIDVKGARHEVERNVALARPFGAFGTTPAPKIFPSKEDRGKVAGFLSRAGISPGMPLVAVAPGSTWKTKAWPAEKHAALIERLGRKYALVLVGGEGDRELCAGLLRKAGGAPGFPVASAAGELSLLESAVLISRARVLVSGDSAPVHLASAVETPVVLIYGPTVKEFGFSPFGVPSVIVERDVPCRPCSAHGPQECPLGHFRCMRDIGVEEVYCAALDLMRETETAGREVGNGG